MPVPADTCAQIEFDVKKMAHDLLANVANAKRFTFSHQAAPGDDLPEGAGFGAKAYTDIDITQGAQFDIASSHGIPHGAKHLNALFATRSTPTLPSSLLSSALTNMPPLAVSGDVAPKIFTSCESTMSTTPSMFDLPGLSSPVSSILCGIDTDAMMSTPATCSSKVASDTSLPPLHVDHGSATPFVSTNQSDSVSGSLPPRLDFSDLPTDVHVGGTLPPVVTPLHATLENMSVAKCGSKSKPRESLFMADQSQCGDFSPADALYLPPLTPIDFNTSDLPTQTLQSACTLPPGPADLLSGAVLPLSSSSSSQPTSSSSMMTLPLPVLPRQTSAPSEHPSVNPWVPRVATQALRGTSVSRDQLKAQGITSAHKVLKLPNVDPAQEKEINSLAELLAGSTAKDISQFQSHISHELSKGVCQQQQHHQSPQSGNSPLSSPRLAPSPPALTADRCAPIVCALDQAKRIVERRLRNALEQAEKLDLLSC